MRLSHDLEGHGKCGWRRHARTTRSHHSSAIFHFTQGQSPAVLRHRRPQLHTGSILLMFLKGLTRLPPRPIKIDSEIGSGDVVHSSQGEYSKQLALRTITLLSVVSHTPLQTSSQTSSPTILPPSASLALVSQVSLWFLKHARHPPVLGPLLCLQHSPYILSGPTPIALSGPLSENFPDHFL